jgi:predicted PurR-regulated permease PerM
MVKIPPYARIIIILLGLSIITVLLYVGQNILIPLLLSFLFAILLRPIVLFLSNKLRFPDVLAVLISVAIFVILVLGIVLFISWQVADISDDWNKIKTNLTQYYHQLQDWVEQRFNISNNKQKSYITQATKETLKGSRELMGDTLDSFTGILLNAVLIPVYTFLILLYRNLLTRFLYKLAGQKHKVTLTEIMINIKTVVQSFIVGLLIEAGIITVLISGGLMLLGVEYALLLGVITALLNLIPYIGILIAGSITILATLINSTSISLILGVIILNTVVQLIDNNFIVPKIVGNKVRINALASIVGVIVGGAIAGVAGMFLAIPIVAILKVIFDRIDSLEAWGFLMGDLPQSHSKQKYKLSFFRNKSGNNKSKETVTKGNQVIGHK